ncbi:iron chelate uptake ABC transporter family permease subunit [Halotia wernerae UHCC 0503]|nr:iron chelate uptake ABC transporter family permease subunit [Halotia wernerae UHCC 0503]
MPFGFGVGGLNAGYFKCYGHFLAFFDGSLGRTLFAPIKLPCGVFTAAVGAPYFLYLLIRNRKK